MTDSVYHDETDFGLRQYRIVPDFPSAAVPAAPAAPDALAAVVAPISPVPTSTVGSPATSPVGYPTRTRAPAVAPAKATNPVIEAEFAQLEKRRVQRLGEENEVTEAIKKEIEMIEKGEESLKASKQGRMAEIEKIVMERQREDEEDRSAFQRRMGWEV